MENELIENNSMEDFISSDLLSNSDGDDLVFQNITERSDTKETERMDDESKPIKVVTPVFPFLTETTSINSPVVPMPRTFMETPARMSAHSLPPPPPPPFGLKLKISVSTPLFKNIPKPTEKLKPLHFDQLTNIEGSIWECIDYEHSYSELDFKAIEDAFRIRKIENSKRNTKSKQSDIALIVLSSKDAKNLEIALKKYPSNNLDKNMDGVLVRALSAIALSYGDSDLAILKDIPCERLFSSELFVKRVLEDGEWREMLNSIEKDHRVRNILEIVEPQLNLYKELVLLVLQSEELRTAFSQLLAMSAFINHGNIRERSKGVSLSCLSNLSHISKFAKLCRSDEIVRLKVICNEAKGISWNQIVSMVEELKSLESNGTNFIQTKFDEVAILKSKLMIYFASSTDNVDKIAKCIFDLL